MEILKEVVVLLAAVIWPVTILVILYWFRSPLMGFFLKVGQMQDADGRSIRLKLGQFEVESKIQESVQKRLEQIAEELSLEKRLEMARQPLMVETALQEIDKASMQALNTLYERRLKDAVLINWYQPFDGVAPETYSKLAKLGLIRGMPMYDGDEVAWLTPVGIALLDRVNKQTR